MLHSWPRLHPAALLARQLHSRPGLCPPAAAGVGAGECLILCLEDKDCPPSQKCCLRDCGRACVPPLQGKAAHPGVCPRLPAGPLRAPCPNACSDDRGCPQDQKCCFTGCDVPLRRLRGQPQQLWDAGSVPPGVRGPR
uniref:WAP domain-containing protein n=1 Tax=Anser brachyrhynchus TaxID=132585 RepID=A0A8B9I567_9AVES